MLERKENIVRESSEYECQKKLVQEMNLMDDDFFQKAMEDIDSCEELIQTILQDESLCVIEADTQKFLRNCGTRSVQLDLLCRSSNNRYFNVEVQKSDKDDHQRRVRYNGSNLDTYATEKGILFKDIPEVYVIYLAKFDIFRGNCTVYHIDRVVRETGEIVDNGFHEIYTNAKVDDGTKIAKLMQYMMNTNGECKEFPRLSKRVKYFKEEQEGVRNMCEAVEQYARERAERAMEESARNLFMNGAGIELVTASIVGLTKQRIQQIYDEVMNESL